MGGGISGGQVGWTHVQTHSPSPQTYQLTHQLSTEAEIEVRMREDFSKVCFETLLQFSFSNKASTPQEGLISRMALAVLLQRSQDVLRRYVEDERLSGRCPLPRYVTATVRCLNPGGNM